MLIGLPSGGPAAALQVFAEVDVCADWSFLAYM